MPRFRSHGVAALAVLPGVMLSPGPTHQNVSAASAASHAVPSWQLAATQHFGLPGNASGYSVILTVGKQVWVFGGTNPGGPSTPVALSLVGSGWRPSSLPAGLSDFISDASAPSAGDIWAVSSYGRYVLHWDGKGWRLARRWPQPGVLSDVVAASPSSVWVFGTSATGNRGIGTWRYDGQRWIKVTGIASEIYRASESADSGLWAIAAGPRSDTIMHLAKNRWHLVPGQPLVGIRWHDILAESANDVWLVGNAASASGLGQLVLAHWNGKRWTRYDTRLQAWAGQLAAAGRKETVATATSSDILASGLIVMISDTGKITSTTIGSSLGSGVSDAAYAPTTDQIWASGAILTRLGGDGAVWVHTIRTTDPRHHEKADHV